MSATRITWRAGTRNPYGDRRRARAGTVRPVASRARSAGRWLGTTTALVAVYYGAAQVGYQLEFAGPVAAVVWPPVGVGIAFLYLGGLRLWPGVVVGDLLVNDYGALPVGSALAQTCGNLLEVLVAVLLLRRLTRHGAPLEDVRGILGMVVAIAAGTAVSATIGTLSLRLGGVVASSELARVWRTWWLGDAAGALVVVPPALAWQVLPSRAWWRAHGLEAALLFAAVAAVATVAFRNDRPLAYLVFPGITWAALRLGQRGATAAVFVTAGVAIWNTTHYLGPFSFQAITHMVLTTQLFIAVIALSALVLAAVVSEREVLAVRLRASRTRVVEAREVERRRIERDLHDGAQGRLTALTLRVGMAAQRAEHEPVDAARMLADAESELQKTIDEIRLLARGVHPGVLTESGLAPGIADVARRSPLPVAVLEMPVERLDAAVEGTAYFVVVEAITNVLRHARATRVEVRVGFDGAALHVEVSDDGVGGARQRPGEGLQGLRDRVEAMAGSFAVESPPGHGTRVRASVPATVRPAPTATSGDA
jgi:signal transduction histidine kinase